MSDTESDFHTNVDDGFKNRFWDGFYKPKTLFNVVQHFAVHYSDTDEKTKNTFAHEIVEDCIIMKTVDMRKLMDLIDSTLSKIDTSKVSIQTKSNSVMQNVEGLSIYHADRLNGNLFQEFVADILRCVGYSDVEVTGKSGDQGGDVLAKKDDKTFVIQAKRYSINNKVSNSAVQEAHGAKSYYNADISAVITNTLYTRGAKDLASKTGTILWDRQDLTRFIAKYNDRYSV